MRMPLIHNLVVSIQNAITHFLKSRLSYVIQIGYYLILIIAINIAKHPLEAVHYVVLHVVVYYRSRFSHQQYMLAIQVSHKYIMNCRKFKARFKEQSRP